LLLVVPGCFEPFPKLKNSFETVQQNKKNFLMKKNFHGLQFFHIHQCFVRLVFEGLLSQIRTKKTPGKTRRFIIYLRAKTNLL